MLGMYESNNVGVTSDIAHLYPEATFIGKYRNRSKHGTHKPFLEFRNIQWSKNIILSRNKG